MAERIKLSGDVAYVRNEVEACCGELNKWVGALIRQDQVTRGGWSAAFAAGKVQSRFRRVDALLKDVQLGTNALGGIRSFPKGKTLNYAPPAPSGTVIRMNENTFQTDRAKVNAHADRLDKAADRLREVWRALNETKVTDQLVSSLDAVDFLFPVLGSLGKAAAIRKILDAAKREVNEARGEICKLVLYFRELSKALDGVRLKLNDAEKQAARRLYEDAMERSSAFQDRKAPRQQMKDAKAELEARQADYTAVYGTASPELAAEIARIKKLLGTEKIYLQPNMGSYSMNQMDYSYFCVPYGNNQGCCATAYAIGLSIVTGNAVNPTKHWSQKVGTTYYSSGRYGGAVGNDLNKFYKGLLRKKPTMFHYRYTYIGKDGKVHSSQHWVLIVGIREGADPEHLTYADFTVINPAGGKQQNLGDLAKKTRGFSPQADSWQFK